MDVPVLADERINLTQAEQNKINQIWSRPGSDYPRKIYNAFINGDWKRQNYYRPTKEHFAQIALYESKSDTVYNSQIRSSQRNIDLSDYFKKCNIPTLIIEGRWDMLWLKTKAYDLSEQHPNAKLIWFEHSAHSPFADEPVLFIKHLSNFINRLKAHSQNNISAWKKNIAQIEKERERFQEREKKFLQLLEKDSVAAIALFENNLIAGKRKFFTETNIHSSARYQIRKGNYHRAIFILELAVKMYSTSADLYELLGDTYTTVGDKTKALENYKKAFRMNPYETYLLNEIANFEHDVP